ncbi:MAG: PQQ-binding-like beta-propeller repeat protein [Pirellulaceae bacterium]|jgi:outer membrane protein assembly factor BamB|nr:PQQ-binding-like beta-propeller repeat protein [Pirellulaceae bacterium]MDP7020323.1 PQQ-binding-like beta-propeller repeat protein [Pirellulaceae bacterium]
MSRFAATFCSPALICCGVTCALTASATAESWHQWRGPQRDGVAHDSPALLEALPASGLKPLWVSSDIDNAKSGGWSSPVVADGRVYLFTHKKFRLGSAKLGRGKFPYLPPEKRVGMSEEEYAEYEKNRRDEQEARARAYRFSETIYCLDASNGKQIWKNETDSRYTRFSQSGSPAIADGKLYVLGAGRIARCVNIADGKNVWSEALPGEFRDQFLQSSFAVADGLAFVVCDRLFALDAGSGKVVWSAGGEKSRAAHTSPVLWRNQVIANIDGKHTIGCDIRTGKELWRVVSEAGHSTPVVSGDKLITYGSSRKRGLRCFQLSGEGAEHLWTYNGAADPGSSPVALNGHIYVQGERRLACVDIATGKAKWMTQLNLNRPRYTSLIAADGKLIYAFDGVIYFDSSPDKFRMLANGRINRAGVLAEEDYFREQLQIDKLETSAEGQREAEKIWRKEIEQAGPLPCATPAIAGGLMYLRLKDGLVCYDLRARQPAR